MKKATLLISGLFAITSLFAQKQQDNNDAVVIPCSDFHITRPLSEIFANTPLDFTLLKKGESEDKGHRKPQTFKKSVADGPQYGNDPSTLQKEMGTSPNKAPIVNFAGQTATGFRPMDPSGAVGPNHYIQMINSTTFRIFNKTGGILLTGTFGNLWTPATGNAGDPIVLYDKAADRWFMSQFSSSNNFYIAISKTNDPTGAYYTYTYTSPAFPDYLKFSVWQDGYYMTSNQAQKVFCFERTAMLAGVPTARSLYTNFSPPQGGGFFVPLPGDAGDGVLPPIGTPCPIFSYSDNGWGGGNIDAVNIYQMAVNWVPAIPTGTITLAGNVPTAAFDGSYNAQWNDCPQPGTTQKLDGIGGTLMFRAQWKTWSGYNTIVLNWGVLVSASQRSIKWCELRQNQTTGVWSMYQEGIYSPDADTRWMGSIAMDNNGGIGMAYLKSNATTIYPSLCYTGRKSCDPLGTLPIAEIVAKAGTGSQTGVNRVGDYSQTTLDPDGVTFWHTGEYMGAGGTAGTQIFSFQLPTCAAIASVTISGTNPICTGASTTFAAIPTNGGTTPIYQWQVNGVNVGTNSTTYTTSTLTTGQIVTCIMTSNLPLVTGSPATSNSIVMVVSPAPATPTASSNTPVCAGTTINLTTPLVAGATYSWTGPNAFTSALQNPSTAAATATMAGVYSVTVTQAGCASLPGTTAVVVNPAPATPTASSNSPVCAGSVINLTTPLVAGATYSWTGPNAFSSTLQNPSTAVATAAMAGTYSVTVTASGCTSAAGTTTVVVSTTPIAAFTGTPTSTVCTGFVQFTDNSTGIITSWLWNFGDGQTATTQSPSHTYLASGTYTVTLTATNGCGNNQLIKTNYITISVPTLPVGTDGSRCGTGTVSLSAAGSGTIHWFDAASGGTDLGTGSPFTTPSISVTTPYYVEDHIVQASQYVGPLTTFAAGQYSATAYTLTFDCLSACSLVSVAVDKQAAGNMLIQLTDAVGTVLQTGTFAVPAGASRVALNWPLTVGTGLRLVGPSANLWRVNSAGTFPYTLPGLVSITGCSSGTRYGSYFDWEIKQPDCVSARTIVTATINPSVVPTVSIAASPIGSICTGTNVTFTATPTNGGTTPAYQWQINGANVGINSATYSSSTLTNGQIVTCVLTSNLSCAVPVTATSNAITMIVSGTSAPTITIVATPIGSVCTGTSVTFTATPTNGGTTPAYQWKLNGVNVGTNSATYSSTTLTTGNIVTCVLTSNSACASPLTATSNAITMTVNPIPATPTAISNSPVCSGVAIIFGTPLVAGASYSWTGPNAFSSTLQNPTTAPSTAAMAGVYSVTITQAGCTSLAGTTTVVVNPAPASPTAGSNSPVCAGAVINLTTPLVAGATYSWTGPNAFTSTLQNPGTAASTAAMAGTYSVTVTISGCTSLAGTTAVVVNPIPVTPTAASNSPVCAGAVINLTTPLVAGATYSWTGPNAFTSTLQNPSTAASTVAMAGIYSVTITRTGCTSLAGTTTVVVNSAPATPTAGSNSPVCTGSVINLTTPLVAGATYSWTGPNAFSSTLQNPSTAASTAAMAGTYSVTVAVSGCTSAAGTTTVVVSTSPVAAFTGTPTSTVCTGFVQFTDNSTGTITSWLWDFGDGQTATTQSPSHTYLASGTYTVTLTATNGCGSNQLIKTNYITISVPTLPVGTDGSRCGTGTVSLSATGSGILHWFNAASGGTDLGTGSPFITPGISTTTPYYVEDHIVQASQFVGPLTTSAAGSYSNTSYTLTFDVLSSSTLVSVAIDKQAAGNILIQLTDAANTVLQTGTFAVPIGASRVTLNWPLPVGTGLKLVGPANAGLWRLTVPGTFPYTLPGLVSITGCSSGTRYGSFFDWEIKQPDCVSSRTIVTATVNTPLTPIVSIAASPSGSVCSGTNVTFTATPTNGGTTPAYQWQVNGANVGTNSTTYSSSTFTNGQIVTCILTSNLSCVAPVTATSNPITVSISATLVPSVIITASPNGNICVGTNVTFTAVPTNGGTTPAYQWKLNGVNVGLNSTTYSNASLANGDIVTCVLTSNFACASPATGTSNALTMTVNPIPATPTAGSNTPVCEGFAINLSTPLVAGASYSWTGPNAFTSTLQNAITGASTAAMAGTYSVTVTQSGCTSAAGTTTVVVNSIPATPTASSNSPVCEGAVIIFTTPLVAGATYSWTGPFGASSTLQNPSIPGALVLMTGTYSVTITVNGCTSAAGTTAVIVNSVPATPTVSSNSPVCAGATINLTTVLVAGATYNWTGPNAFTSTLQNAITGASTAAMAGTYSVTVTQAGCTSLAGTTVVVVNPIPATPTAGSNSPVCAGAVINLTTALVAGATYSWTGPNAFTSILQNPSTAASTAAMAGSYSVTITQAGCTSLAGPTAVVVNPVPATPTAASNSPVCAGSLINLTTPLVAGATYSWTGPNGFTSTLQNPVTAASTAAMAGTYSVTVAQSGCTSLAGTSTVVVNPIPATPTAGSNSPVCAGAVINLTTSLVAGATYSWTGPNAFTSTLQNPSTAASTAAMAGTYSVTLTQSGCTGLAGTTTVVVNPIPVMPTAVSNSPVCEGATINLTTAPVAGATYSWTGPNGFSSTIRNSNIASSTAAMAGTYSVTVTRTGCTSLAGTTTVSVIPTAVPALSIAITSGSNPSCFATNVTFTATPTDGGTIPAYQWQLNGINVGANSTTYSNAALSNGDIITCILTSNANCASTTTATSNAITMTVSATVAPIVSIAASPNGSICTGTNVTFTATPTNGGTIPAYQWQLNGLNIGTNSASYSNAALVTGNIVTCILTSNSACASPTTATSNALTMTVNPTPSTPIAGSNSPVCEGAPINLTTALVAGATYSWTGPNAFTSILQNPSTAASTAAMAGTYSVTVTQSGCTSLAGTTTVVVKLLPSTPSAGSNSPVCAGATINLTTAVVAGATYSWTGPNGFTSTLQNPVTAASTAAMAGTYSVNVTQTGCTSLAGTTTVVVNNVPATPTAGSNSPVCTGTIINLTTALVAGATYNWTGPNTFTSTLQNPSTAASTAAMAGTYSVTVTQSGCTSLAGTTAVVVNPIPSTPTAGSNSPVCAGATINLTTPVVVGATYSWTGPNAFLSAIRNPNIAASTAAMAGTYSVTVTQTGCTSLAGTTTVLVNPVPATPIAGSNSPVCAGATINLTTALVAGASYSWTGPNAFTSTLQNPSTAISTVAMAGTYSVTVTQSGCTSAAGSTSVVVNPIPTTPTANSNSPVCEGATINLTTPLVAGATYSWTGPFGSSSTLQNPSIPGASVLMTGSYSVTISVNGCTSAAGTTAVVVNPIPATPTTASNSPVCAGAIINLTTPLVVGASYSWIGPNAFTSALQNPNTAPSTAAMAGTYSLTVTQSGCTSAPRITTVIVNPIPSTPTAGSNTPVCEGSTIDLSTPLVAGATYSWTGPNGFISASQNPSTAASTTAMTGTYSVTVTQAACTSLAGTTAVVVNPIVVPVVSIAITSGSNPSCLATNVTFTATPTNGGIIPDYQWQLNGINVGINSDTYSDATLANGDIVTCIMSSNASCASPITTISNAVVMSVSATVAPTVSIVSSPNGSICAGTNVTFTATAGSGGATPSYQWTLNGVNIGTNSDTYSNATLVNGDIVTCIVTSSLSCASPTSATSNAVTMSVSATVAPTVSIAVSPNGSVCAGTNVTFTATPSNGGTTPAYQWQLNGMNTGINSDTYSNSSLSNSDVVTCILASNAICTSPATATSNAITMVITPIVVPSVSILASPNGSVCAGTNVTFTATPSNGGTTPAYQWQLNGANTGANAATYSSSALANGDIVTCILTSSLSCASPTTATSNAITMSVSTTVVPTVSILASPNGSICTGTNVTFTATESNGGATPAYQWLLNGANTGANAATYSSSALANGDIVTCILTSSLSCASPTTATSNAITMSVSTTVAPTVSILASPNGSICTGTNVTFTATESNGGATPAYQWQLNGANTGANAATYSSSALANGDIVTCILTSSLSCASPTTATSNAIILSVSATVAPTVSILASPNGSICPGTNVTFTATEGNGGTTPAYQWQLNGVNTGTNTASYSNSTLANGDVVTCILTSSLSCASPTTATSNAITMSVSTTVAPTVSILASPNGSICTGTNVTFTATESNGGATPAYQWQLNGANTGANAASYSNSTLANGDVVTCILTSSLSCASPTTATSNAITMSVSATVAPTVSILASPNGSICPGTNVTFTATEGNGGATPAYQWQLNGVNTGTNTASYSNSTLANGDVVTCILTSSLSCASPTTATSNAITTNISTVALTTSSTTVSCAGGNNGTVTVSANGGVSPYNYLWSDAASQSLATATALTAGNYSVTVTDNIGCTQTATVVISQPAAISLSVSTATANCGMNNGIATVVATGGTGAYTYLWNSAPAQTTATASALAAGTYSVNVTDNNNCSQSGIALVGTASSLSLTVSIVKVSCKNGNDGQATVTVNGGIPLYTYLWNTTPAQTTATASGLTTGTYNIKVTDAAGCMQTVSVIVSEPPVLTATSTHVNTICGDNSGSATLIVSGGTPPYAYFWNSGQLTSTLSGIDTGTYQVIINDAKLCSLRDTIIIKDSITEACLFIPNSFSPNEDGNHDLFVIEYLNLYHNVSVGIYNRWGNIVYSNSDYQNDWDGKRNGADLPGGVYYYIIDLNNGQKTLSGPLTILR